MGRKKTKPGKLPKRIVGVKLPKAARKQAERAIAELRQPIVREMIAGAVGMAASAMARQAASMRTAPAPISEPEAKPEAAADTAKGAGAKAGNAPFAEIVTGLAVAGLGKLIEKMQAAGEAKKLEEKG